jgi:hypothetical protein
MLVDNLKSGMKTTSPKGGTPLLKPDSGSVFQNDLHIHIRKFSRGYKIMFIFQGRGTLVHV